MKYINYIITTFIFMFSLNAYADPFNPSGSCAHATNMVLVPQGTPHNFASYNNQCYQMNQYPNGTQARCLEPRPECTHSNGFPFYQRTAQIQYPDPPNATCTGATTQATRICECNEGFYYNEETNDCTGSPPLTCSGENQVVINEACGCDPNGNFPHARYRTGEGEYCSNTTANQDDIIAGLIAAGLGINIAIAAGLAGGLAACAAIVVCAAGLVLAGLGALLAGAGFVLDDGSGSPPPTTSEPAPLIIELKPIPDTGGSSPNTATLDPKGGIKAPTNSTPNPDGTRSYDSGSGSPFKIDEDNSIISRTNNNPDGSTTTTTIKNTPNGAEVTISRKSNYGIAPDGSQVKQIESYKATGINASNANSVTPEKVISYENNGTISDSPPTGTVNTGGSGNGTGSGTGSGGNPSTGDCPDCATETTQLQNKQLLTSINQKLSNEETAESDLMQYGDLEASDFKQMMIDAVPFYNIINFEPNTSGAQCPPLDLSDMQFMGLGGGVSTYHCQFAADNQQTIHATMEIVYYIAALFILLS